MFPTHGETVARKLGIKKMSVTIGHADLTAAGVTETETIGTIPAGSVVLAVNIAVGTAFTGIAGPIGVDIGTAGDVDALVDNAVISTAVDGEASTCPAGISPNKQFAAATTLIATVVSSSGNLVDASAGAMTIDIFYVTGIGT